MASEKASYPSATFAVIPLIIELVPNYHKMKLLSGQTVKDYIKGCLTVRETFSPSILCRDYHTHRDVWIHIIEQVVTGLFFHHVLKKGDFL